MNMCHVCVIYSGVHFFSSIVGHLRLPRYYFMDRRVLHLARLPGGLPARHLHKARWVIRTCSTATKSFFLFSLIRCTFISLPTFSHFSYLISPTISLSTRRTSLVSYPPAQAAAIAIPATMAHPVIRPSAVKAARVVAERALRLACANASRAGRGAIAARPSAE